MAKYIEIIGSRQGVKGLILNYEGKLADVQTGPKTKRKMLAFILMKKEQPIISALGQFFQNTCST